MKRRWSTISSAAERSRKFWAVWRPTVLAVWHWVTYMLGKSRSGSQGHTGAEEQLFLSRLMILELKLFQLMTKLRVSLGSECQRWTCKARDGGTTVPDGPHSGQETTQDGGQDWSGKGGCEGGKVPRCSMSRQQGSQLVAMRNTEKGGLSPRAETPEGRQEGWQTDGGLTQSRLCNTVAGTWRSLSSSTCTVPSEISQIANCSHTKESPKNNAHYFFNNLASITLSFASYLYTYLFQNPEGEKKNVWSCVIPRIKWDLRRDWKTVWALLQDTRTRKWLLPNKMHSRQSRHQTTASWVSLQEL